MRHLPANLDQQQEDNLRKLAGVLEYGHFPQRFDLIDFARHVQDEFDDPRLESPHSCITVFDNHRLRRCLRVCAIGLAPFAGILPRTDDSWHSYAARELCNGTSDCDASAYAWIFSRRWRPTDNSAASAVRRIRYMLAHSIPPNWEQQRSGREPPCYA